jgi:hypothetical protein
MRFIPAPYRPVAFFVLFFTVALSAEAQTDTTGKSASCWRGQPPPVCSSFFIFEFGYDAELVTTRRHIPFVTPGGLRSFVEPDFGDRVTWTLGPMFNTGPRRALGGTLSVASVFNGAYVAAEVRRRWWSPPKDAALDLSAGVLRADLPSVRSSATSAGYGLTAGVHLVSSDIVNFRGNANLVLRNGKPAFSATAGGGLGSYMAAVVTPVALIIVVVANAYAHN